MSQAQTRQAPTPHAIRSSREIWQGIPRSFAKLRIIFNEPEISPEEIKILLIGIPDLIASITAFLDSLDEKQRYSALVHLSVLWAQSHDNPKRGELE